MFRITTIIRNLFIRLEALFSVLLNNIFSFFKSFFGFLGKLFGLSKSEYFLESEEAQGIKRNLPKQPTVAEPQTTPTAPTVTRRRNPQMDYYLEMAKQVKKD
jgi:hypothetical protein